MGIDPPRPRRVLVVDDEPQNLEVLEALLEDDWDVHTASDGRRALDLAREVGVFDVVIADQRMPRMTGVELLAELASLQPDSIRVVLTGYTDLEPMVEAVNRGDVYRFLLKPFDDAEIRSLVAESMRVRAGRLSLGLLKERLSRENAELESTLRRLRDSEEQVLAAERVATLGHLTSGIVHDLGNLTTIMTMMLEAVSFPSEDEDALASVNRAREGVSSLTELIVLLRDFARKDTDLRRELVSVERFFRHTVQLFDMEEENSARCEARVDLATGRDRLLIDESWLRQALLALLRNAGLAGSPGGVVDLTVREQGDDLLIEVADRGRGMSQEEICEARRPFVSGFSRERLGLGLVIVELVAEAHGGDLRIESEPGEGTLARLRLPDAFWDKETRDERA